MRLVSHTVHFSAAIYDCSGHVAPRAAIFSAAKMRRLSGSVPSCLGADSSSKRGHAKTFSLVVLAAMLYGGYTFLQKFQIDGLDKLSLKPRSGSPAEVRQSGFECAGARSRASIKIASFNIQCSARPNLKSRK